MGVRRPRAAARFGRGMLRVRLACLAACASALFLAGAATEAAAQPVVTAVRVAEPPAIDGLLADDAWRRAARLSAFVQTAPVEGAAATESTEVSIVYDGENLYVGIRARYAEPGLMRANRADRDQIAEDDTVSLFFDPFRDRQRAYQFTVNGFGVQGDAILNSTGLRNRSQRRALGARNRGSANTPPSGIPEGDISWDALFVSAGAPAETTAGRRSWRFRSRACGTRRSTRARRTVGGSRSHARSRGRTRRSSGRPSRGASHSSWRRWGCWKGSPISRRAAIWRSCRP